MTTDWKAEFNLYVRARYPVIWVVTSEEERAERILREAAQDLGKQIHFWTCTQGYGAAGGGAGASVLTPVDALKSVADSPERAIFVLKDFHAHLEDPAVVRRLRDVAIGLRRSYKTLAVLSPVLKLPPEVEKDIVVMDLPLPAMEEMRTLLKNFLSSVNQTKKIEVPKDDTVLERMAKAALGLTENQASNVFARALVNDRSFTDTDLPLIIAEKKQIIRKSGLLEYYDLAETLNDVGGLDELKRWLLERNNAFSEKARTYGLPEPKGLLMLGVQGCGKSLTSKAIASVWKLPLLRLDVGNVFSSFVGSSEENMRKALRISESLAPCVLWLDEIEKGLSGMKSSGASDAGTTARVFGTFLTWLQEKTKPVFVVATANRIEDLPPELLRKGRFDEIFFIDLPSAEERKTIFEIHLRRRRRDPKKFDVEAMTAKAAGFSGAEIEQAIVAAMYTAFAKDREITTPDVVTAMEQTVPLSQTLREEIDYLRNWAKTRAKPASGAPIAGVEPGPVRKAAAAVRPAT